MGKNVAEQFMDAERVRKAVLMRVRGAHWSEIAKACDFPSPAAALQAVGEAMKEATGRAAETADQMKDTANLQYDALTRETWKVIDGGEELLEVSEETGLVTASSATAAAAMKLRAVDEARRLVEAKAKLNKLDASAEGEKETDRLVIVFETDAD